MPAIVRVAPRAVVAVFAWTLKLTVALPMPEAALVRAIQVGTPLTFQLQFAEVVSETFPLPPASLNDAELAESE